MPHRPRAGAVGIGVRRSPARGLAGAGHGRIVQRPGLRAAALSRPARAGGRCRAHVARQCARTRAALAQPPARGSPPRPALARCHRARNRRACGRGDRAAGGDGRSAARRRSPPARTRPRPFPPPTIALDGWMEQLVPLHPAVEVEDRYRATLRDNRARDAAAGRTLDGPHLTDLTVIHAGKGIAAADASTGEQKALLIGLVLAHAGLLAEMSGFAPVLLLDEVVAHLDPSRRAALYDELRQLGAQAWMTGADAAAFAEIEGRADMLEVSPGQIGKRTTRFVMRAAYYEANGPAREVLRVADVETPQPGRGEVRVRLAHLRRQSLRRQEPRRPDAQDRLPARDPAQRRRGRDRRRGRRRFAGARRRAGLGLERPMAAPLRHRRRMDRAAVGTGGARCPPMSAMEAGACLGIPAYTGYQAVLLARRQGRLHRAGGRRRRRRRPLRHPVREEAQGHRHHHRELAGQGRDRAAGGRRPCRSTTSARTSASGSWRSPASAASTP